MNVWSCFGVPLPERAHDSSDTDPLFRNKWVLNNTDTPLFFLLSQLVIAVILFLFAHTAGLLQLPLQLDMQVCKGLIPMVGLNVVGLRFVSHYAWYVYVF